MRLYYASAILVQVLLAILFSDKDEMAYRLYPLEDISGWTRAPKPAIESTVVLEFIETISEENNDEFTLLLER